MFLKAIRFQNYRAFKSAELALAPLTILIGPNSSGKTSALSAISTMAKLAKGENLAPHQLLPIGMEGVQGAAPGLEAVWDNSGLTRFIWPLNRAPHLDSKGDPLAQQHVNRLGSGRVYALDPAQIAANVMLTKTLEIQENGAGLPAVLTTLQDQWPERFELLNRDLRHWLPEFDRILFDTPTTGQRAITLRTASGSHIVPTGKLSAGTLLSLTLLSISHLPTPAGIVGLEEPDHGIHPRLLRGLKDSLLRLTAPAAFDDNREPVQVIVTTHSPYLVDLFHDELDAVVVTHKEGLYANLSRLIDFPNVTEIVKDTALGEAWYSGILGGVPVGS